MGCFRVKHIDSVNNQLPDLQSIFCHHINRLSHTIFYVTSPIAIVFELPLLNSNNCPLMKDISLPCLPVIHLISIFFLYAHYLAKNTSFKLNTFEFC